MIALSSSRRSCTSTVVLFYVLLIGSGIYCGMLVAEIYHDPLKAVYIVHHNEKIIQRSRNLMSDRVDIQHVIKQKRLRAEGSGRSLQRPDHMTIPHYTEQGEMLLKLPKQQDSLTGHTRQEHSFVKSPSVINDGIKQANPLLLRLVGASLHHEEVMSSNAETSEPLAIIITSKAKLEKSNGLNPLGHSKLPIRLPLLQSTLNASGILNNSLPFTDLYTAKTTHSKSYHKSKSIAGCLFIMDDTIRLLEWLAYHYTVLPLSHLMVAIDPKSQNADRIMEILNSWKDKINIKAYQNDTEWLDLPWDYGYSRKIRNRNGELMKWYREEKSEVYFGQVHKRRQNYFCVQCMRHMKEQGMDWTIITDSDEYLMFNYPHQEQEDENLYDSIKRGTTISDIEDERKRWAPYRDRLPAMEKRVTVAEYIYHEKVPVKCIMFPGLQFTSYESLESDVYKGVPQGINPYNLVTLRHRKAGHREGTFSKTMVDVSNGEMEDYTMETNVNVHVPNKLLCGMNGNSGSRQDYISSIFRLHHYRSGTWESFIERAADRRANMTVDRFTERNIDPQLVDDDIRPWIAWFVEKVGMEEVRLLLIDPLAEAYSKYGDVSLQ